MSRKQARKDCIFSIIKASSSYGENLHSELQHQLQEDLNFVIHKSHKLCIANVTVSNIAKKPHTDDEGTTTEPSPTKRKRRSATPEFSFKEHCLYCGQICNVKKDPKNPRRWRPAYLFHVIEYERKGKDPLPVKDLIIRCNERKDNLADNVRIRLEGAIGDLHAAGARYHVDCKQRFHTRARS